MVRPPKKPRHVKLVTLLAVGEGAADKAFLYHLRHMYGRDTGQKVTIEAEDGGSPSTMITNMLRKHKHQAFDRRILVLDEDIPIDVQAQNKAHQGNIELIISSPICLEGMLLDVLGQKVPEGSQAQFCKRILHPQLSGPETKRESYQELFPQPVIDATDKRQIIRLRNLMQNKV